MTNEKKTAAALIAEARDLETLVSHGPWVVDDAEIFSEAGLVCQWGMQTEDQWKRDAAFICRSRTLLGELADALEAATSSPKPSRRDQIVAAIRLAKRDLYEAGDRHDWDGADSAEARIAQLKANLRELDEEGADG